MSNTDLHRLFEPRNIAVIGASSTLGKWGAIIFFNILNGGFPGAIYPVNPGRKTVMGLDCYASVADIPEPVDLAMITTPAPTVLPLIDACGVKGIPFVIVVTSNFSETGPEGTRLEREVVARARSYGMRIVGPNTMGIFSSRRDLHALMPPVMPLRGPVSMFSQSGNLGTQMLAWGSSVGVGFEKFISSGNEGDLTCVDYLRYYGDDPATKVILAYLEGVDPHSDFLSVAREVSRKKPLVALKGGRTRVGGRAAASHSGAMAGSTDIYRGAFRQSGVIQVSTTQGLIDCAKAFSHCPLPRGNRVAIVTRGGGWGVITADACEENGLEVPPLPEDLVRKIDKVLPPYWSRSNPVDMVAALGPEPIEACLKIIAQWDGVDAIIAAGAAGGMAMQVPERSRLPEDYKKNLSQLFNPRQTHFRKLDETLELIKDLVKQKGKPIINLAFRRPDSDGEAPHDPAIVTFPTPERAVRVLRRMAEYQAYLTGA